MRVHLVAFADGPFRARADVLTGQARRLDLFDTITVHDLSTLPSDFLARHGAFIERSERGFGYWLWKPAVILDALRQAQPDDIVAYIDSGCSLNPGGRERMLDYLDITRGHAEGTLATSMAHVEAHWTKADLAHFLGIPDRDPRMLTGQIAATFLLLRPTAQNCDLVREWLALAAAQDYRFLDDSPSVRPNHPRFVEHRHDQSILSLMLKTKGTALLAEEIECWRRYWLPELPPEALPVWATRRRDTTGLPDLRTPRRRLRRAWKQLWT